MATPVMQRTYHDNEFYGHSKPINGDIHGNVEYNENHYHHSGPVEDPDQDILDAIFLSVPEVDREELISAKGRRVTGTCEWIVENATFKAWLDGDTSTLWIRGGPGRGKTILSVYLTQQLEDSAKVQGFEFLYFFCRYEEQHTAAILLRSILWQILRSNPDIFGVLRPWFGTKERATYSVSSKEVLWLMLTRVLTAIRRKRVCCLLDGLDELENESMVWLIDKLLEFRETEAERTESEDFTFQILVVSRDIAGLRSLPQIRLDSDHDNHTLHDIELFVATRTRQVAQRLDGIGKNEDVSRTMQEALLTRAMGSFLWIGFAMYELKLAETRTELMLALQQLPAGLPAYYERMLLQIKQRHRQRSASILRWIALTRRPLTLSELAAALGVKSEATMSAEALVRDQVIVCGPILQINGEMVSMIHHSAREYLLDLQAHNESENFDVFHINSDEALLDVANFCIRYLEDSAIQYQRIADNNPNRRRYTPISRSTRKLMRGMPFLKYAATHWLDHVVKLSSASMEKMFQLGFFRLRKHVGRAIWADIYSYLVPEVDIDFDTPLLHLACACGFQSWVEMVLNFEGDDLVHDTQCEANTSHGDNQPRDHTSTGADEDAMSDIGTGKKHVAFQVSPNEEASGARKDALPWNHVNQYDHEHRTALDMAIKFGHEAIVHVLLAKGARAKSYMVYDTPPLFKAVRRGQRSIVKLLLDHGAPLCWEQIPSSPNLSRHTWDIIDAAVHSDADIVQLLLDRGADVFSARGSALRTAMRDNRQDIALVMIRHAVKILEENPRPGALLMQHAQYGHFEVILGYANSTRRLPQIRFSRRDWIHFMRFSDRPIATEEGYKVMNFFVECGIDLQYVNKAGTTLLHRIRDEAAKAEFLLDNGVPLEARDRYGQTALHRAVSRAEPEVVALLLARGAAVDAQDSKGRSPVFKADGIGKLQLLLDYHASLDVRDNDECTPLLYSSRSRSEGDEMAVLLAAGSDASAHDDQGMTALHHAAKAHSRGAIKVLLNWPVDINAQDHDGRTALQLAFATMADGGHFWNRGAYDVIKLLVEKGSNVNFIDDSGNTPLHWISALPATMRVKQDGQLSRWRRDSESSYWASGSDDDESSEREQCGLEGLASDTESSTRWSGLGENISEQWESEPRGSDGSNRSDKLDSDQPLQAVPRIRSESEVADMDLESICPGFMRGYKLFSDLMLSHGADASVRNLEGKTAEDLKIQSIAVLLWLSDKQADDSGESEYMWEMNAKSFWNDAPGKPRDANDEDSLMDWSPRDATHSYSRSLDSENSSSLSADELGQAQGTSREERAISNDMGKSGESSASFESDGEEGGVLLNAAI